MPGPRWTVLLYLAGDTSALAKSIMTDVEEAHRAKLPDNLGVAMFVDLPVKFEPNGAMRYLLRGGQAPYNEALGSIDSGSTATLKDFLLWGIREMPAEHYALVVGGTGMLDPNSIIGNPVHNWTDVFAICDDATSKTAMDVADLRGVMEAVLDEADVDRFRIVAFDMCKMQFLEVAYQLETVAEIAIAAQTDVPSGGWNYERLLTSWGEDIKAADDERADNALDTTAAKVAKTIVREATASYEGHGNREVVVSAIDLGRLDDLTRDFDALTLAYMQALGDFISWTAREKVVQLAHGDSNSYDLKRLLATIQQELNRLVKQPLQVWLASILRETDKARREDYMRALELACARQRLPGSARRSAESDEAARVVSTCVDSLRDIRKGGWQSGPDDIQLPDGRVDGSRDVWSQCFADPTILPARLREEYEAFKQERDRATYLAKLAGRTLRHFSDDPENGSVIIARSPATPARAHGLCGIALYRPKKLDRLIDSNYLKLEFTRRVHWAALLGATDLIERDHRALWRVVSSMLGSADARGREDLIERLVGQTSVASSYRGQFRSLAPSPLVTLSLEPLFDGRTWEKKALSDRYRLRLQSIRRDATLKENETRVNPSTIECALSGLERLLKQGWVDSEDLDQIESFGRTLGEDIIQDLQNSLSSELAASGDRDLHMLLQIPQQLMRYPWELMHDGQDWLSERYALGRQIFMEQSAVRWSAERRTGGVRVLIIGDPILQSEQPFRQLPGARDEAEHVAALFERLQEQVGVALEFDRRRDAHIHQVVTRDDCRRWLRSGAYDIIHFAGHAFFDPEEPLRSGWVLSDGPLWAQEIRNTLMRSAPPWLVYANACEAGMDEARSLPKYQGDVHGLASAFVNKGVGAYIAPLWPIDDGMAMKLAADFYTLMALERMTVGEALCHAKRRAKKAVLGNGDARDALVTVPANMGLSWASLVLYGDPTQTLVQQLAARNETRLGVPPPRLLEPPRRGRHRRVAQRGEAPLQAAPSTLPEMVGGPGMRPLDRLRGPADLRESEDELLVMEQGGIRYWAKSSDGEPESLVEVGGMPKVAQYAQARLQKDRGFADYVKIVARWATGRLEQGLIGEIVRQYDYDVVHTERLLVHDPITGGLRPYSKNDDKSTSSNPQAQGCLLLIHGTFSKSAAPVAGLGRGFFDWAHRNYRQVLAFDHWTLSKSPLENAQMLLRMLPPWIAGDKHPLDIVTHSRGGLVARALVQLPLGDGADAVRIGGAVKRVIFVGTPNFGTSLANPNNWARAADLLINLVHIDAFGLYGKLSGLLARLAVAKLGGEVLERIPGLQAQNPASRVDQFLGQLRHATRPAKIRFSAVSTNYEPRRDEANLKLIARLAGDAAIDEFFQGYNDLVVDSRNVWLDGTANGLPFIDRESLLVITPADSGFDVPDGPLASLYGVHHTNLFETEQTREFLVNQLRRPAL